MRIVTALILVFLFGHSDAQLRRWISTDETRSTFSNVAFGVQPGYLIAHRPDLKNLESHTIGAELNWQRFHFNADWAKYYKNPVIGYGLSYTYLGKESTGHGLSLHSNLQFTVFSLGPKTNANIRISTGLGLVSRRFDPVNNRRNQAIGSNANAYLQTAGYFSTEFNKGILDYGLAASHFSNAAFSAPNLGYNMPSFLLRWAPRAKGVIGATGMSKDSVRFNKHWAWSINTVFGIKERNFAKPVKFTPWGMMFRGMRVANPIRRWRVGFDMVSDKTYGYQLDNHRDLSKLSFSEQFEFGITAGHEWRVANLRFMLEAGYYLVKPVERFKNPMYQRMGLLYNATDQWGIHATLKFHRGVADYMEWGLSYTIDAS